SWLGTKWLHSRIFRSPDSFVRGSVNVSLGASPGLLLGATGDSSFEQALAAAAPSATTPVVRRKSRRLRGVPKRPETESAIAGSSLGFARNAIARREQCHPVTQGHHVTDVATATASSSTDSPSSRKDTARTAARDKTADRDRDPHKHRCHPTRAGAGTPTGEP